MLCEIFWAWNRGNSELGHRTMAFDHIDDARQIACPGFVQENGVVYVYEADGPRATQAKIPFSIARVFAVHTSITSARGHHAHRACRQFLVCLSGRCRVRFSDGANWRETTLSSSDVGLLIPAGIWTEQNYDAGSILLVMCDQPYDEDDYIRDFGNFLAFRDGGRGQP